MNSQSNGARKIPYARIATEGVVVIGILLALAIDTGWAEHRERKAEHEADTPVFDGLVRSGRIEIIEDRRIIDAPAEWERLSRNTAEFELRARRYVDNLLLPAIIARANIAHVLLNQYSWTQIVRLGPDSARGVGVDVEIMSLVAQRYFHTSISIKGREEIQDAADRVIASITEFLEK